MSRMEIKMPIKVSMKPSAQNLQRLAIAKDELAKLENE